MNPLIEKLKAAQANCTNAFGWEPGAEKTALDAQDAATIEAMVSLDERIADLYSRLEKIAEDMSRLVEVDAARRRENLRRSRAEAGGDMSDNEMLPVVIGMRILALRETPESHAAEAGWKGTVTGSGLDISADQPQRPAIAVYFDEVTPGRTPCEQVYFLEEWTAKNVEILDGAQ